MSRFARWAAISSTAMVGSLVASTLAPLVVVAPAVAQANFTDVSFGYWARPFIQQLAEQNIIAGFPDGTFRPDQPVTRAQFAAIVRQAFSQQPTRQYRGFTDIAPTYWATPAIQEAYATGFLSGYPDGSFRPDQQIPRVQALVSLSSGLNLQAQGTPATVLNRFYRDANQVPNYAEPAIAAATQNQLVVNYPNPNYLNPDQVATRADVAAFVYQALVNQGELQPIPAQAQAANYIVNRTAAIPPTPRPDEQPGGQPTIVGGRVPRGTRIDLKYPGNRDVSLVIAPGETVSTTLLVANPIRSDRGQVIIPANSQVRGRFVPVRVNNVLGTQFVAERLIIGNASYDISATSTTQFPATRQTVQPGDLQGAITTAAARQILGGLFGNQVNLDNLLAGILGGGTTGTTAQGNVIIIDPQDLELVLQSPLNVRR